MKGPIPKFPYKANQFETIGLIAGGSGISGSRGHVGTLPRAHARSSSCSAALAGHAAHCEQPRRQD